jgi:hypothetical protein
LLLIFLRFVDGVALVSSLLRFRWDVEVVKNDDILNVPFISWGPKISFVNVYQPLNKVAFIVRAKTF